MKKQELKPGDTVISKGDDYMFPGALGHVVEIGRGNVLVSWQNVDDKRYSKSGNEITLWHSRLNLHLIDANKSKDPNMAFKMKQRRRKCQA